MPLRFHWMLPQAGESNASSPEVSARLRVDQARPGSPVAVPDLSGWVDFARRAEAAGVESVLISISRHEPDPMVVATALGCATSTLKFIVAYRSGLMLPTTFVQQINTLSCLIGDRVAFNMVAGSSTAEQHAYGDYVGHDDRYARATEFLALCHELWNPATRADTGVDFEGKYYRVENGHFPTPFRATGRIGAEVYVSGHSSSAERLALEQGTCWLRAAEPPEQIASIVQRTRARGVEVGLRMCVACRPSRAEAIDLVESIAPECEKGIWDPWGDARDDSTFYQESSARPAWLSPTLWSQLVPRCGPVWTTLVGTPAEVATALLEYGRIGVTQFILSSWPETAEVARFGREVIPLVRAAEAREARH